MLSFSMPGLLPWERIRAECASCHHLGLLLDWNPWLPLYSNCVFSVLNHTYSCTFCWLRDLDPNPSILRFVREDHFVLHGWNHLLDAPWFAPWSCCWVSLLNLWSEYVEGENTKWPRAWPRITWSRVTRSRVNWYRVTWPRSPGPGHLAPVIWFRVTWSRVNWSRVTWPRSPGPGHLIPGHLVQGRLIRSWMRYPLGTHVSQCRWLECGSALISEFSRRVSNKSKIFTLTHFQPSSSWKGHFITHSHVC